MWIRFVDGIRRGQVRNVEPLVGRNAILAGDAEETGDPNDEKAAQGRRRRTRTRRAEKKGRRS